MPGQKQAKPNRAINSCGLYGVPLFVRKDLQLKLAIKLLR